MRLIDRMLIAIFPQRCDLCGDVVQVNETRCEACLKSSKIAGEICHKCGVEKDKCLCKQSHKTPDFQQIIAPYYYSDNIVKAVHTFKFGSFPELAKGMSIEMLDAIKREYSSISFDAVTYVPISKKREKARGYNQSLLLAKEISKQLGVPLEHTFYKAYESPPLRTRSARQRRADVFGAFDINDDILPQGKTYLVVDDVKTTGATLSECTAVLDSYGAKSTYAVTFAIRNKDNKKA